MQHRSIRWRKGVAVTFGLYFVMQCTAGCATLVHGHRERIAFQSTPWGATAHVTGPSVEYSVVTPGTLDLPRTKNYDVQFEKEGYLPATARITQQTSAWIFGNVLWAPLGLAIGIAVDEKVGGGYNLEPATVEVTLVADPSPSPTPNGSSEPPRVPAADKP